MPNDLSFFEWRRWMGLAVVIGATAAALPVTARAQGAPNTPSATQKGASATAVLATPLDELIRQALASAPSIAAQRARLAAAQAAQPAAGVPDDPMVEFEYRDAGFPRQTVGSDPMSMVGAMVRQPLLSRARRTSQRAVSAAEVAMQHAETDAVACDLTSAIRTEYARIFIIDRERAVLRDANELASLLARTAAARYAAGESDQAAVLRAQLEQSRIGERIVDLEGERAVVVAGLNRLVGLAPDTPLGDVLELPSLPALPAGFDALPSLAGKVAPEVAVRQAGVDLSGTRVDAARAELGRTYTVGGGLYWQGGTDRVVTLTLGIELPFRKDRRQRPMIAAAAQELTAAKFDLADARNDAMGRAAQMVAEIKRADAQIERYRQALLPQSSAAFDAARASFLGGRGEFAAVLDEFRRWTEVRVELARREASRFTAHAQLDVLVNPLEHGDWRHEGATDARVSGGTR